MKPPAPDSGARPRVRTSGLVRLLVRLLILGAVALAVLVVLLPGLAEDRIRARLATWGGSWQLQVRHVGWSGLELADVRGAKGRIACTSLRVDYDPRELLRGRLRRVQVVGATWELRQSDDGLDLGLEVPAGLEGSPPGAVEEIEVLASTLVLRLEGRTLRVPLQARLERVADEYALELDLGLGGMEWKVRGSLPASAAGPVALTVAPASGGVLPLTGALAGGALLRVGGELGPGTRPWRIEVAGRLDELDETLAGHHLALDEARFGLEVLLPGDGVPPTVGGELSASAPRLDDLGLRAARLTVTPESDRARVALALEGDGEDLVEMALDVPRDLQPWIDRAVTATVHGRVRRTQALPAALGGTGVAVGEISGRATLRPDRVDLLLDGRPSLDVALGGSGRLSVVAPASGDGAGWLTFDPRRGLDTLVLELPRLEVEGAGLASPDDRLGVEGATFALPLALAVKDRRAELRPVAPGRVGAERASWETGASTVTCAPLALRVVLDGVLALPIDGASPPTVSGSFGFSQDDPFEVSHERFQARGRDLRLEGRLVEGEEGPRVASVRACVDLDRIAVPEAELELEGLRIDLPVPLGPPPAASEAAGVLAVEALVWKGTRLAGPCARVERRADGLDLSGSWELAPDARLELDGRVLVDERRAELGVTGAAFALHHVEALDDLVRDLTGARVEALLDLEASGRVDGSGVNGTLTLATADATIESESGEHRLEGVHLTLSLENLLAPRSVGPARVGWSGGRTGELALAPGEVRFALESPTTLLVQGAELSTAGGSRLWTQGLRFERDGPLVHVRVFAQELSVAELLALTLKDRATGEGVLTGDVAFTVDPARASRIELTGGRLVAVGTGTLQVQDREVVDELLARSMATIEISEGVDLSQLIRDRIVGALGDFAYEGLSLDLVPEQGDVTLRLLADGKGRLVPQELDLSLDVLGFGYLVSRLLELKLGQDR